MEVSSRRVLTTAGLCSALVAFGCENPGNPPVRPALVERSQVSMGTEVHLAAWTNDEPRALDAFQAVFTEFDRLDGLMSVWRQGSDVVRINDNAGRQPVHVTDEVQQVLQAARQVSEWTEGKFDVTFAALSGLWRFDQDIDGRVPPRAEIEARLPFVDYRAVTLDEKTGTVVLESTGFQVNLGGIGKGYAVDRGAALLRAAGVNDFTIQAGGDLYVAGRRGDRSWRAGIQDPRGPSGEVFAATDLSNLAFSTSGDYERFFLRDGRRYHHILDPDTGEPAPLCRSVTILAKSATVADGLSTGVFVLGVEKGMALIERLPDVEGVIVSGGNELHVSSGLREHLDLLRAPTDGP
jgi:thiamine biosynthesis lipoprotein